MVLSHLLLSGLSLGCQNYMRNTLGVWTFTDNDMKLVIGQEIRSLACLAVIRIGEARFVGVRRSHYDYLLTLSIGLATNFLLIESLQRFYQYYGDDLQVSYDPFNDCGHNGNYPRSNVLREAETI